MHLVLIGFMASGKSTVASLLGALLGLTVVDMDQGVCHKTGAPTMADVIARGGELLLRQTEIALAWEYAEQPPQIVATGGGIVLNKIALDYFKARGAQVFFLDVPFEEIKRRLHLDAARPLVRSTDEAQALYDFRLPLYRRYADHCIPSERRGAQEVAEEIAHRFIKGSHGI